jgi:hypothetical protein
MREEHELSLLIHRLAPNERHRCVERNHKSIGTFYAGNPDGQGLLCIDDLDARYICNQAQRRLGSRSCCEMDLRNRSSMKTSASRKGWP